MPHRNKSRKLTNIYFFLVVISMLTLQLNHSSATPLKPEVEAIQAQQLTLSKQKKQPQSIRLAVLPFYSDSPAMKKIVDDSRLLVTAEMEDSTNIDLVSQDLIPTIKKNLLHRWYPEMPGRIQSKHRDTFAWKTGAQVFVRGQVFPPITIKKKPLTKPLLVLTAQSVETGKVVIMSLNVSTTDWTNRVKELGEKMAVELQKTQRAMTVTNLLKSGLIHTTTVSLGKTPRPNIRLAIDSAKSDKTVSVKQRQFLLTELSARFRTLGFNPQQKKTGKKNPTILVRASIKTSMLVDDKSKKHKQTLIKITLTKSNKPKFRRTISQLILHRSKLNDGLKVLAAKVATELLVPKPVFKKVSVKSVVLPGSPSAHSNRREK